MTVFDFNSVLHWRHSFRLNTWRGMAHEHWPNRSCPALRLLAQARIQYVHSALSGPASTPEIFLPRSVSLHGLRATHQPRQPARHRNLFACHVCQSLSRWLSWPRLLKKELKLDRSLNEILQILSITLFEKSPISTVLNTLDEQKRKTSSHYQLLLFDL